MDPGNSQQNSVAQALSAGARDSQQQGQHQVRPLGCSAALMYETQELSFLFLPALLHLHFVCPVVELVLLLILGWGLRLLFLLSHESAWS